MYLPKLRLAKKMEHLSRLLLPTCYAIFVFIYFLTCFVAMEYPHNVKSFKN